VGSRNAAVTIAGVACVSAATVGAVVAARSYPATVDLAFGFLGFSRVALASRWSPP
jgi:hypothetical protein